MIEESRNTRPHWNNTASVSRLRSFVFKPDKLRQAHPKCLGHESVQDGINSTVGVHEKEAEWGEGLIEIASNIIVWHIILTDLPQMIGEITQSKGGNEHNKHSNSGVS